ncbi:hypothetical protein GCM10010218_10950 [Streptomyces mashuensis]|uniref:Uncharacterized protein n=1 Tax=Streptomyces mashuensis TaxID=33904 RepID=A0A919AYV2_9ACTN|nr:hypothetical protein [Streptomyces mashuensis]GHF31833.1 hypothetical protein GCM10010218_10950 [Streptomyces mashuensis]
MGWTVLYIAFAVVALWLLGEVLLQYKARLRWRLLAFAGFLGVVAGVVIPSVAVIVAGTLAFGVGQTFVTLSFRRGFSRGWALRRKPDAEEAPDATQGGRGRRAGRGGKGGKSGAKSSAPAAGPRSSGRRRKGGDRPATPPPPAADATLPVSGPDALAALSADGPAPGVPQQPLSDEDRAAAPATDPGFPAHDPYGMPAGTPAQGYAAPYDDYGHGQGQYAAYSDPYIGNRPPSYETYDPYGRQQQPAAPQQYGGNGAWASTDPYAPHRYDTDTPPGGIWVPQQRDTDQPGQQPYPPQQLPGQGYDDQQRRY